MTNADGSLTRAGRLPTIGGMGRSRWAAVLCVLTYLAVGTAYLSVVPAWEAPDEPWHAVYAEVLAAGRLPAAADTYEWHQPPGYYALMAVGLRLLGLSQLPRWQSNPRHPFAVAALMHPPDDPAESPLRLLRTLSSLFGAVVVALAWATARRVWPAARGVAPAAALLVALWPQYQFITHSLSNDTLAALAGAVTSYGLVRVVMSPNRPLPGAMAVAVGLTGGLFAKLNALALAPALIVALLAIWRTRPSDRKPALRALGLAALVPVALALLTMAAWPALLGGLAGTAQERATGLGAGLDLVDLTRLTAEMAVTFVGRFGWLNVPLPKALTALIASGMLLGVLGLLRLRGQPPRLRWSVAVLMTVVASTAAAAIKNLMADPQPQGRFLFPALAALSVVVAVGWRLLLGERRWAPSVAVAGLALLAVNVWVVAGLIPAAYQDSRRPAAQVLWRTMGNVPEAHVPVSVTRTVALRQTFHVDHSGPFQVAVPLAKASAEEIGATLRVSDARGRVLGEARVDRVRPGQWLSVDVVPGGRPVVQPLALEFSVEASNAQDVLEPWATTRDVAPDGQLTVNGRPQPFDLVMVVSAAAAPTAP
jgi:hypothetical protein